MHDRWKKISVVLIFAGGFSLFFLLGGDQYLSYERLQGKRQVIKAFTENHYWAMLLATAVTYAVSTALSLPLATGLSLIAGFLFGRWVGMVVILCSATVGATLVFLGARYVFADVARGRLKGTARRVIDEFHKNDFNYLLFLRLVPLFPFWLVNLAAAFTPMKTCTYVAATALGITPGCFVFANLGESLGHIDSVGNLLSFETLSAMTLLGLLALLPVLVRKVRSSRHEKALL